MSIIKNTESKDFSLDSAIADFQSYLEYRNMSANTTRAYLYAVRQFHEQFEEANHANLMLYKCYLLERYKPQTVNLRIRAVNSYMEYRNQPDSKIKMLRIQRKFFVENVISQADYEYLKNCLQRDGQNIYYFAVRIMATTGMRVSELLQTTVEDIQNGYIDLISKGDRIRRIFFVHDVCDSCLLWLRDIDRTTGYVFLNRYGDRISDVGLRVQLKQLADRYGLNPSVVHPHAFRHLFARNFIENCDDIALLSDILGHESIETTRIYLQRSSTEQKQIVNQVVDW